MQYINCAKEKHMNHDIQPQLYDVSAHCTNCGADFQTQSTQQEIRVALCSVCHPFFTGEQKFVDTAGRVEKFKRKYAKRYNNES